MRIGGIQKTSLIDYPGEIACILFLQGCNFRCSYCHNPELVDPQQYGPTLDEIEVLDFLKSRQGKIQVVITGGEPLIYSDTIDFLRKIKAMGFKIKLDTNGSFPERLKEIIDESLVDYIAMDIKASVDEYANIVMRSIDMEAVQKSIKLIMQSGIDYEFRSTIAKGFHTSEMLIHMAKLIAGAKAYFLQNFRKDKILDIEARLSSFSEEELNNLLEIVKKHVPHAEIRNI